MPSRRPIHRWLAAVSTVAAVISPYVASGQAVGRRPLGATEIDAIARLEMMEDRRQFDSTELAGLLGAPHLEVRRRAALAVARLADRRGITLLRSSKFDTDTAFAATIVFAVGQFRDSLAVSWFDSLLTSSKTPPSVLTEAAVALGKIKNAESRAVLARFLLATSASPRTNSAIGEALLSIGRAVPRGDIAPIVKWTRSPSEELRWRSTWALFRPRDPAAVAVLLTMSNDPSALVRSWAVRGLSKSQSDSAGLGAKAEARLLVATRDTDRRVRTEAIRALSTYSDSSALSAVVRAVESPDSWVSVSAAEGLGRIRSAATLATLVAATGASRPCALRVTAMQSLQTFAPRDAMAAADQMARDTVAYCRAIGVQALARDTTRSIASRRADLTSQDTTIRVAALRAMGTWADTNDIPMLLDLYDRARIDPSPSVASATVSAIAAIQRRRGVLVSQFFARFSPPENPSLRRDIDRAFGAASREAWPAVVPATRSLADYRQIVERWVVPAYNGRPNPTARWETNRGSIELELYPGDAPLAVDYFVRVMESGAIIGTEFTRVVPDFVDQQQTIRNGSVQRDEVNRHRLTRGNLAWATAGLDTGIPGYTLNHTPQPHNEGDFTSVGRVIRGMDVVDRIELGDKVTAAKMVVR